MGVSRGSFYWHFTDIDAYRAAILKHWREVAAEQIIADLEEHRGDEPPLHRLLRRSFGDRLALERAVRTWATLDPVARKAVESIDRRRLGYVESLLEQSGLPQDIAQARAQILYWAFLGFALSDKPLTGKRQAAVLEQLIRTASP
jgi:AcrR family transcriptional regulator